MNRFAYWRDPLCGLSLALYAVNHLLVVPHGAGWVMANLPWAWGFLHSHLDDLLFLPAALPVVLWMQRGLGLREHDGPPAWSEMAGHLAVWTVMCKLVGPFYLHIGVADPSDVWFFAAGGIAAVMWWQRSAARGVARTT